VRDSDPGLIAAMVAFLQRQEWCGPVFTRAGVGALGQARVGIAHRRAGDIVLALRSDDAANEHGVSGSCRHDSDYPVGGGLHGGLHRKELHNWMAAEGDAFRRGHVSALPAGIIDVMPTVLDLLGLPVPASVQGRVLREALAAHADQPLPVATRETVSADGAAGHRAHLSLGRVGATTYLERGWVD